MCCWADCNIIGLQQRVPEKSPLAGPVIIGKAKSFYDETGTTDKCIVSKRSNKKLYIRCWVNIGTV